MGGGGRIVTKDTETESVGTSSCNLFTERVRSGREVYKTGDGLFLVDQWFNKKSVKVL